MSHLVTIKSEVKDPAAVSAACQRLGLPMPVTGSADIFATKATGLIVQLPNWVYPVVIDTASGTVHYDNYREQWGSSRELDKFMQAYSVEKAKLAAQAKNCTVNESVLQDGSIRLQIVGA